MLKAPIGVKGRRVRLRVPACRAASFTKTLGFHGLSLLVLLFSHPFFALSIQFCSSGNAGMLEKGDVPGFEGPECSMQRKGTGYSIHGIRFSAGVIP
ncbi:hypothetical protein Holit_01427 [Hollandina sp. SP2]